ncbi:putative CtpA-like serine protease [Streptomyces sp. YIM 121038]|uniref:S41 family peptidase n=1 Tax=Streptomyces sp. YIM 121038 TaxID=2136401 RepID=UPI001110F5CE|nr:S41 family peptidase [Streptomyces sp. YIM 121038]QCX76938.1 putative CtpA-like serine protease [Streptomyces sp. YIM 121038]
MSGPEWLSSPRRVRRGAALTLVFASVLATGAATGSWSEDSPEGRNSAAPPTRSVASARDRDRDRDPERERGPAEDAADAAAEAMADGKSGTEAAEDAVSRSGDRWASVYSQGEYEEFEQALGGAYTGVGLWARRAADGRIEVSKVRGDGPAARAGIRQGDRLVTVDGHKVKGHPVTEVVSLLRGAREGTPVELGLERGTRAWRTTLHRERLSTDSVSVTRLTGGAVKIKVDAFTKGSGAAVRDAVRRAPRGAGVLLDLRGNAGGLVTEAVTAASALLDGGLVATYDVRGRQRALHARPGGDAARPVVALVDGGTMSAAELLTGALQDRGRAVVVGSRTFGKGSVQMPSRLPDGSVAELTVGHYRTPSGRGVDRRGITPDLEVGGGAQERAETVLTGLGPPS